MSVKTTLACRDDLAEVLTLLDSVRNLLGNKDEVVWAKVWELVYADAILAAEAYVAASTQASP